ncbi:hypothetical protein GCM10027084_22220 [Pseudoxanthomonas sangjuensis]|uniref:RDD family protein n=1 Tax=Pseudoxanthomonas sangjuensis TaxID=1503750 RepID=UPI00139092A8|nr:RDD family protein [Pseudoxanthomonas sangjuensis]KAF1715064.1 hypothetical protein CSC71_02295 [Pseudoxanthomonas sangjuensis]
MEQNPYQAPETAVVDPARDDQLAGRGERLAAALLDTVIMLVLVCPVMFTTGYWQAASSGQAPGFGMQLLYGLMGFVIFVLVQGYPLSASGQTWGKRLMKIRIVDLQGEKPSFATLIAKRYLPVQVAGLVPFLGNLAALVDVLMIFRADCRCGHDLIAGTRVVKAD